MTDREEAPDRDWIIQDWLPAGRVALLAGAGGTGKSRLALQLACAMAADCKQAESHWIDGHDTLSVAGRHRESPVVFASWEDDHAEQTRRLLDWPTCGRDRTRLNALLGSRLHTIWLSGRGPIWGPEEALHRATRAGLLPIGRQLLDYAADAKARLLVIDPAAAAFGSNENDRAAVREFMSALDAWGQQAGCAALVIAHPAKAPESEYSGSTDWHGAARTLWTFGLEKHGSKPEGRGAKDKRAALPTLQCLKANYARPPKPVVADKGSWTWWKSVDARPLAEAIDGAGGNGSQHV